MTIDHIIQEIRTAREQRGLSQAELADAAGISLRTYQRFESGEPGARIDTLVRVLNVIGRTISTAARVRPTLEELESIYGENT